MVKRRPQSRLVDEIREIREVRWMRAVQNRDEWKRFEEASTSRWVAVDDDDLIYQFGGNQLADFFPKTKSKIIL